MNFTTLQDTAATALGIVGKAVANRTTLPVLANVLIETDGTAAVALTACNLETYLRVELGAKVDKPGSTTLPHKTLSDLVASLPQEPLSWSLDEARQTTTLKCGRTKSNIKGIAASEFPAMPRLNRDNATAIKAQDLREMVRAVEFASAYGDSAQPVLVSQYWRLGGGMLKLAATDGFRVAEVSRQMDGPTSAAVIPARAAEILAAIIDGEEDVLFEMSNGRALFRVGSVELVALLIDGAYPTYEGIVPKSTGTRATFATSEAVRACKTIDVIARGKRDTHAMRVTVTPGTSLEPGRVTFRGEDAETGDGAVEIDAKVDGPAIEFGVSAIYAREAFESVKSPSLSVEAVSPTSPVMVRPVGDNVPDGGQWSITMPLHLGK